MSILNSSFTSAFRPDGAVLFAKANGVRAVHQRPCMSAYHESRKGQTNLPPFFCSLAAAHSSPTPPQWALFRLFSTPASLRFTTPSDHLRPWLLSDCSNIVWWNTASRAKFVEFYNFLNMHMYFFKKNIIVNNQKHKKMKYSVKSVFFF